MAKINSRAKGATFERFVAKTISEWWGCDARRTPLSGGWGAAVTAGDIILLPPEKDDPEFDSRFARYRDWPFSVECKAHKELSIDALFHSPDKSPLSKFLVQCCIAASRENRIPLLVAKRNNGKPLAFIVLPKQTKFPCRVSAVITLADVETEQVIHVLPFQSLTAVPPAELLNSIR